MKKALTEDEKMIKEAQLLKSAETDKGDSASLSSDKLSRLENENKQLKKQVDRKSGKIATMKTKIHQYQKDLSAAHQTINSQDEEIRRLREENALLKREKFATTSQKQSSASKSTEGRDKEEIEFTGEKNDPVTEQTSQVTEQEVPEQSVPKLYPQRPPKERPKTYKQMKADIVEEYNTQEDYPEGMTFKEFKNIEVYDRVCYVRKMVFKVAVLVDEDGREHDFFKPEKGKEAFTPESYKPFPDTNCTPRFMASVLDMRYNLNMPVRRVLKSLESDGMHMCQQSLHNWITSAHDMLGSVEVCLKKKLLDEGAVLHIDETWCRVRIKSEEHKNGKYMKKYIWVLVNKKTKTVYYLYDNDENDSRARRPMTDFIAGYRVSAVHSDAYNAYKCFDCEQSRIVHLLCWAHTRAKFLFSSIIAKDAEAFWFLEQIGKLYGVEREIRNLNMTPEQIKERRNREDVKTIMRELYEKAQDLWDNPEEYHYSELMKKALKYMLNGWDGLQKYIEDGNYDIDNSLSERSIRPFTVGRSACKGFTSEEGVMIAARFYTLVETCKLNGVSPRDYFVKVLESLTNDYGDYEKLTPDRINEI